MKFSHLFQLQSRLCRNTKRSLIILPLAIPLLTACENILPEAVEQLTTQPQAHHSEGKTSVYVRGIETEKDLIVVDLLAINAHDRKIELSDKHDPLVLVDSQGNEYTAAKQEISLQPYTSNNLTIAFLGSPQSDRDLTLKINSDNDYILTPQMSIEGITLKRGKRIEFATYQPRQVKLTDTVFHHPNGLTFTIKEIKYGDRQIEVAFEAVNGYRNNIDLAQNSWNLPFLEDERGNKYSFVPLSSGNLEIPTQQTVSGVLKFGGRVPESVNNLTLYLNNQGSDKDNTDRPKIVVANLPAPSSEIATIINQNEENENEDTASNTSSLPYEQGLNLQVNHANGSVLRLTRIAVTEDYIETDLTITNGYRDAITLNRNNFRQMRLRDNLGNNYNLAPPPQNPDIEIKAGQILEGKFRFLGRIDPNAQSLTLVTNEGSQNYVNNLTPYMAIANIPVASTEEEEDNFIQPVNNNTTTLPTSQTLDLQANHANGSVLRLKRISFEEDNIVADLAITNGYKNEIRLNSNNDMRLRDNLGNIYNLATLPQNPEVKVSPGQTLTGQFVFLGRISPQASSLTLVTNDKRYGSEELYSTRPKIAIANIPIETNPTSEANNPTDTNEPVTANPTNSLTASQTVDKQVNHANGSVLRLKEITFRDDSIVADLSVTNGYKYEIALNRSRGFLLRDNIGSVYYLATIPQNPQVKISPGQTLTGKFVFLGRISPQASFLTLVTNDKLGNDGEFTNNPKMIVDNIEIDRP